MSPAPTLSRAARRRLQFGPGGTIRFRDQDGKIQITSADRGRSYVTEGRAKFGPDGILYFFEYDYRVIAAAKLARRPRFHDMGLASQEAIEGVPVIKAKTLLFGRWIPDRAEVRPDTRIVVSVKADSVAECLKTFAPPPWPRPYPRQS